MSDEREVPRGELSRARLERLERGELDADDTRRTVRRLLAADPAPVDPATVRWPRLAKGSADERPIDVRVAQAHQSGLEAAAPAAEQLFAELERLPVDRQRLLVCKDARFHSWSLCKLLLDRSWRSGFNDPIQALQLAEVAVSVAYELGTDAVPEELVFDLKARAWALLGNARRIASDLRGAEKAFELAESLIERGSGDPIEQGRILELHASLHIGRRRLDRAARNLRRADVLYRRAGAHHRQGRVLISRGLLAGRSEQIEQAVGLLRAGLEQIDPEREPRLPLVATHNLCFYLNELGRRDEALDLLGKARELHHALANRLDLIRLRWLEGRVKLAAGRIDEAESAFAEVRRQFIEQEIGYDAALASLDLASVYARQGRAAEMRELAQEMIPIFQSRDLGREVMAAWIVFENAARMESASVSLIDELTSLLKASRSDQAESPLGSTD